MRRWMPCDVKHKNKTRFLVPSLTLADPNITICEHQGLKLQGQKVFLQSDYPDTEKSFPIWWRRFPKVQLSLQAVCQFYNFPCTANFHHNWRRNLLLTSRSSFLMLFAVNVTQQHPSSQAVKLLSFVLKSAVNRSHSNWRSCLVHITVCGYRLNCRDDRRLLLSFPSVIPRTQTSATLRHIFCSDPGNPEAVSSCHPKLAFKYVFHAIRESKIVRN
jgi:hypothetical protein